MKPAPVPPTVRLLAALLVLGGVVGIVTPLLILVSKYHEVVAQTVWWAWVSLGIGFLMFAWSGWLGVTLWDGDPRSLRWARMTFIAQIPSVAVHGIGYEFQTLGITIQLFFASGWRFNLHAGSNAGVGFVPFNNNLIFGVNVVAIAAVVYLNGVISAAADKTAPRSDFGLI